MAILAGTAMATIPLTEAIAQTSDKKMKDAVKKFFVLGLLMVAIGAVSVGIIS